MKRKITKAAVLGAGMMGSTIAAHLSNAGIPTCLLDMVPSNATEAASQKGVSPDSPSFRNKLAITGLNNALKTSPAAFFTPKNAQLITPGNFEDHMGWTSDADWIIEAVAEDLDIKKKLLTQAAQFRKSDAVISTNTSGLSVNEICEGFSEKFKAHFLGTHFFNPPRYMKLLEIIPGNSTSADVITLVVDFCERRLGKGIVLAKDTPNFVANRIGVYGTLVTIRAMLEAGYSIDEVDAITGPLMARPKSATFRTLDLVGLDVFARVTANIYNRMADPKEKAAFETPALIQKMVQTGLLGEKVQKGFYQKVWTDTGSQIHSLNHQTLEYAPQQAVSMAGLKEIAKIPDPAARVTRLASSREHAGQFAWTILKKTLLYCASSLPLIADDVVSVDRAMKWGFSWDLGPFEIWDAIGVRKASERMEQEGEQIPQNISQMLKEGYESFYQRTDSRISYFDFIEAGYQEIEEKPQIIILNSLKERNMTLQSNAGADLIDLGNGVACLEFHSLSNAIGYDFIDMINYSVAKVEEDFEGMVITNVGPNFCFGANLMIILFEIQRRNWGGLDLLVKQFQGACRRIKFAQKPVVVAPSGMALAGGCEVCMAGAKVRASVETYMGLVEVSVGLIPAGGGCKEMLLRSTEYLPESLPSAFPGGAKPDLSPYVARAFETIALAKVSTSAAEAQALGYIRPQDRITMNRDHLIHEAKQSVLGLAADGYVPAVPRTDIRVPGRTGRALLDLMVYSMTEGGFASKYDAHIAGKLAKVLTGGDVDRNTAVTEEYLLDLEREAFLSLCGERKTQDRIINMLRFNKPLRN